MSRKIPRLELEQLTPQLREALAPRVRRLGYLGEFFKCAGHQPQALLAFMDFTESSKAGLPEKLVELIALTVATYVGNDYERHQHERLAQRLGFGEAWIEAIEQLDPAVLDGEEAVVQTYVLAALQEMGRGTSIAFEALVDVLGPERSMAVLMVVGRYLTHALIVNTLELAPPVTSIFTR